MITDYFVTLNFTVQYSCKDEIANASVLNIKNIIEDRVAIGRKDTYIFSPDKEAGSAVYPSPVALFFCAGEGKTVMYVSFRPKASARKEHHYEKLQERLQNPQDKHKEQKNLHLLWS